MMSKAEIQALLAEAPRIVEHAVRMGWVKRPEGRQYSPNYLYQRAKVPKHKPRFEIPD